MNNEGWDKYQIHVLSEIAELKEGQKRQDEDHARVYQTLSELRSELSSMRTSQKWELRVLSAVWGLIVLGIDAILRYGK